MRAGRAGPVGAVRNCTEIFSGSRRARPEPDPPDWFFTSRMPSIERYRLLAERCRRLAEIHSEQEWAGRLIDLAHEYEKGAAMNVGSRSGAPDSPGGESSEEVQG